MGGAGATDHCPDFAEAEGVLIDSWPSMRLSPAATTVDPYLCEVAFRGIAGETALQRGLLRATSAASPSPISRSGSTRGHIGGLDHPRAGSTSEVRKHSRHILMRTSESKEPLATLWF